VRAKILGLTALLLMLTLWASYFYVFKENRDGQLGGAGESTAWCGTPPSTEAALLGKDQLTLRVTNNLRGEFMLSGSLVVSERTFNRYDLVATNCVCASNRCSGRMASRRSSSNRSGPAAEPQPRLTDQKRLRRAWATADRRAGPGHRLSVRHLSLRLQTGAVLPQGQRAHRLRFKNITTLMDLSNTFTPIQKYNRVEYINEKTR
jgi:hypothetical protein